MKQLFLKNGMSLHVKTVWDGKDRYITVLTNRPPVGEEKSEKTWKVLYSVHKGDKSNLNVLVGDFTITEWQWYEITEMNEIIENFDFYFNMLDQISETLIAEKAQAERNAVDWQKRYYDACGAADKLNLKVREQQTKIKELESENSRLRWIAQ